MQWFVMHARGLGVCVGIGSPPVCVRLVLHLHLHLHLVVWGVDELCAPTLKHLKRTKLNLIA